MAKILEFPAGSRSLFKRLYQIRDQRLHKQNIGTEDGNLIGSHEVVIDHETGHGVEKIMLDAGAIHILTSDLIIYRKIQL